MSADIRNANKSPSEPYLSPRRFSIYFSISGSRDLPRRKDTGAMDELKQGKRYWRKMDAEAEAIALKNGTVEIWKDDSDTQAAFVETIINDNRRLAGAIVRAWLDKHHKLVINDPTPQT